MVGGPHLLSGGSQQCGVSKAIALHSGRFCLEVAEEDTFDLATALLRVQQDFQVKGHPVACNA